MRSLKADYFDGSSARAHRVDVVVDDGVLAIVGEGFRRRLSPGEVQWPELHGASRVAHLRGGGELHAVDTVAFDEFVRQSAARPSLVARAQQSWRASALAVLLLVALGAAGYVWGVPLASRTVLAFIPESVDRSIGAAAVASIGSTWLKPSKLPEADRQRLSAALKRAVDLAYEPHVRPAYELRFHGSRIGPNAFALPGGIVVVTDELVDLAAGRDDIVVAVLAHELGHVRHRHAMRSLVQITLLGAAASLAFGDFSSLFAAAPALLGQLAYSRDFEREADRESVRVMRAAGLSPAAMVAFFDKLVREREDPGGGAGIAFSTHPADAERIRFFRDASRP